MPSYTKAQILNFLDNKITQAYRGETTPQAAGQKWLLLKFIRICVENDIVTPAMVNTAFTEFP